MNYKKFIESKRISFDGCGFEAKDIPDKLFDFQKAIVEWACRKGRAAVFANTGLGKSFIQVSWAQQVRNHTHGMVLLVAPLCVAEQTVKEAEKLGIYIK